MHRDFYCENTETEMRIWNKQTKKKESLYMGEGATDATQPI